LCRGCLRQLHGAVGAVRIVCTGQIVPFAVTIELFRCLAFPQWFHECFAHNHSDIAAGITLWGRMGSLDYGFKTILETLCGRRRTSMHTTIVHTVHATTHSLWCGKSVISLLALTLITDTVPQYSCPIPGILSLRYCAECRPNST
jgi:hypothetical protein